MKQFPFFDIQAKHRHLSATYYHNPLNTLRDLQASHHHMLQLPEHLTLFYLHTMHSPTLEDTNYVEKYSDHVDGQNERNRKARHYDRVKTIDAILENNKTCPEETLLQLGNMDGAVSADVLAQVSAEYFEEFNRRYGSHVHILDWALHLDEATPHIHERHVFDAVNQY